MSSLQKVLEDAVALAKVAVLQNPFAEPLLDKLLNASVYPEYNCPPDTVAWTNPPWEGSGEIEVHVCLDAHEAEARAVSEQLKVDERYTLLAALTMSILHELYHHVYDAEYYMNVARKAIKAKHPQADDASVDRVATLLTNLFHDVVVNTFSAGDTIRVLMEKVGHPLAAVAVVGRLAATLDMYVYQHTLRKFLNKLVMQKVLDADAADRASNVVESATPDQILLKAAEGLKIAAEGIVSLSAKGSNFNFDFGSSGQGQGKGQGKGHGRGRKKGRKKGGVKKGVGSPVKLSDAEPFSGADYNPGLTDVGKLIESLAQSGGQQGNQRGTGKSKGFSHTVSAFVKAFDEMVTNSEQVYDDMVQLTVDLKEIIQSLAGSKSDLTPFRYSPADYSAQMSLFAQGFMTRVKLYAPTESKPYPVVAVFDVSASVHSENYVRQVLTLLWSLKLQYGIRVAVVAFSTDVVVEELTDVQTVAETVKKVAGGVTNAWKAFEVAAEVAKHAGGKVNLLVLSDFFFEHTWFDKLKDVPVDRLLLIGYATDPGNVVGAARVAGRLLETEVEAYIKVPGEDAYLPLEVT